MHEVLSPLLCTVVMDVVSSEARRGLPSELLLFALIRSVFKSVKRSVVKSVKIPVVEVAELSNRFCHRSSIDKSVGCALQANNCLTSCGEASQSVQMSLGSPNTLCL